MSLMMCPHCGRLYSHKKCRPLMPEHQFTEGRQVVMEKCPGSGQTPRNAESDMRPLWKDEVKS